MSAAQQTYQQAVDHVFLAHNLFAHLHAQHIDESTLAVDALVQFLNVYRFHCLLLFLFPYYNFWI